MGAKTDGSVVYRKKLSRGKLLSFLASQPSCMVAMEACGSAHYWSREIMTLGHEVRLVPPIYVKPFVKRHKNDASDAEAISEAAQRPTMHFVAIKTEAQRARGGMLFRTRDLLVRQRTQTMNALRGHLAEFGVVAPQGVAQIGRLRGALEDPNADLPEWVRELGRLFLEQIDELGEKIHGLDKKLRACAREDEEAARLMTIPGNGPITALAIQALAPPMESFRRGRDLLRLAWPGAAATHDRGQAEAWQDIEDGPARSQAALDHRRHGGHPSREPARRGDGSLAGRDVGAEAEDAGRGGAGQQDGAHRVGRDDAEGDLPNSCRRLNGWRKERSRSGESCRGCGRDVRTGKGKRSMRRDRENQLVTKGSQAWSSDMDLIRVPPYGPAATRRINRPDRRQHLTTMYRTGLQTACINGGVHRRLLEERRSVGGVRGSVFMGKGFHVSFPRTAPRGREGAPMWMRPSQQDKVEEDC